MSTGFSVWELTLRWKYRRSDRLWLCNIYTAPPFFIANCESGHFVSPGDVEIGLSRRLFRQPPGQIPTARWNHRRI